MKILVLGKNGQIGWELCRSLSLLGQVLPIGRAEADLSDQDGLRALLRSRAVDVVVNAAAYTEVDRAEQEVDLARRVNAVAAGVLAQECDRIGACLVHYSTDYVFDGEKPGAYAENDRPNPLNVYGRTKYEGESLIRALNARHFILRTSWVYAPRGRNFARTILGLARQCPGLEVVDDQVGAPTSASLVADVTALVLYRTMIDPGRAPFGTYHVTASGDTSWFAYARHLLQRARACNVPLMCAPEAVRPVASAARPSAARRPRNSRLNTDKIESLFGLRLPDWRDDVSRFVESLAEDRSKV